MTTYEDDFNDEERLTYQQIRIDAMESAYQTCKSLLLPSYQGKISDMPEVYIFNGFFDETYECHDDVTELMYRTLELLLKRGLGSEISRDWCYRIIKDILSRHSFDELAQYMSEEEVIDLRNDLQLLKFID